jgi:hypothetical protein
VLTLLEVDPTGKSALEVGTVSLNLAEFASADPGAHAQRAFSVVALPAIVGAWAHGRACTTHEAPGGILAPCAPADARARVLLRSHRGHAQAAAGGGVPPARRGRRAQRRRKQRR